MSKLPRRNVPPAKEPWWKQHAGAVSALGAIAAAALAVPAAIVAIQQAASARADAADARRRLAAMEAIVKTSAIAADANVREANAAESSSRSQGTIARESAKQTSSIGNAAHATVELSATDRARLDFERGRAEDARWPLLSLKRQMNWRGFEAGGKPEFDVVVTNGRPEASGTFWIVSSTSIRRNGAQVEIKQCTGDVDRNANFIGPEDAPQTLSRTVALSIEEAEAIRSGAATVVLAGSICVTDGKTYRGASFCREVRGQTWYACLR